MIYIVASVAQRRKTGKWLSEIVLDPAHSVEVVGLLLPILYFFFIWWKSFLSIWDGAVLIFLYLAYLYVLNKMPAQSHEEADELDAVPRAVMKLRPGARGAAITGLFLLGGLILYLVIHPFVDSLKALALSVGISEFVFIQWVAPFLSEFPEKVSVMPRPRPK
jgi:cation:H+ antiporter